MFKILDTNIILLDAYNIVNLANKNNTTVVIPATVVDEIDAKKSGLSEIAYQARQFGRLLSQGEVVRSEVHIRKDIQVYEVTYAIDSAFVIISSPLVYPNFSETEASIRRDREIIYTASLYTDAEALFITNDVMCRIRAIADNVQTSDHKLIEDTDLEFIKHMLVDNDLFTELHRYPITDVDLLYKPENYNYIFENVDTGQTKLATITNGLITVLGKDTEKELRQQDINPINAGQLFFSKAIQDSATDIVVCDSKAGTGKTVVALSNAIRLVKLGKYDSILYIRASVDDLDKAEEIGFLSGNDEKTQVYLHPLEDALDFIIRNRFKDSKLKGADLEVKIQEEIEKLRARCAIEAMIGLGMRGRTFRNCIAIIDEAQNQSKASLQKMLTRFADNCKVILIGSNKQIDNAYLTKYTNGLSTILSACSRANDSVKLHAVSLPKVVRGKIAEFAENLFSKDK